MAMKTSPGDALLIASTLDYGQKGLKKYWKFHEDSIKMWVEPQSSLMAPRICPPPRRPKSRVPALRVCLPRQSFNTSPSARNNA